METQFCKVVDFHFNKGHFQDPKIPMWVLKAKGETHYIHHLDSTAPWSTRETPDHPSTKGSIRFRNVYVSIKDGIATISPQEELAFA